MQGPARPDDAPQRECPGLRARLAELWRIAWYRPDVGAGSSVRVRFAHGLSWSAACTVLSQGVAMVSGILLVRFLQDVGYGQLRMLQSTVGVFGMLAGLGLGLTATRQVAALRTAEPERAGRVLGMLLTLSWVSGTVMAAVLFAGSELLAAHVLKSPDLAEYVRVYAAAMVLGCVNGVQSGALSGCEAFRHSAILGAVSAVLTSVAYAAGAALFGLRGAVWAGFGIGAVNYGLYRRALHVELARYGIRAAHRGVFVEKGILWSFSLPTMLSGMMVGPVTWASNLIFIRRENGYGDLGVYNALAQWRTFICFLPALLGGVLLPILTNLSAGKERAKYWRLVRVSVAAAAGTSGLGALGVLIAGPFILRLYGPGFTPYYGGLVLVVCTAVLVAVLGIVQQVIASRGAMWVGFGVNAAWGVVLIAATRLFREQGASGLALAYLVSYGCLTVLAGGYMVLLSRRRGLDASSTTH